MTHPDTSRIGTGTTSPNSTWNVLAEVGQDATSDTTFLAVCVNLCEPFSLPFPYIHLSHTICQQRFVPSAHCSICSPRSCQLSYLQSLRFYRSPSSFSQTSWIVRMLYFPKSSVYHAPAHLEMSLGEGVRCGKSMKTSVLILETAFIETIPFPSNFLDSS